MEKFFRRFFGKASNYENCAYKQIKKQKEYCDRKRCVYAFGMNKDTIFCTYCCYRKNDLNIRK